MTQLRVNLHRQINESYDITFGKNLFPQVAQYAKVNKLASKYAIITDSNVGELYSSQLENALKRKGLEVTTFDFEAGENSKTMNTCNRIIHEMLEQGYARDSAILALGGGVVGDMAGFIASIFMRGIPYIQIPTTILSQADSAVGGKTGVDTIHGKNQIGTFLQPKAVYVDVNTLQTLPDLEVRNGLAETIKHAVIADYGFFEFLEKNLDKILQKNPKILLDISQHNCEIKARVVEEDSHEDGWRRILNYGHTIGHAIENLCDYVWPHGQCVAVGMMVEGRIAQSFHFSKEHLQRQERLLRAAGLVTQVPHHINNDQILKTMLGDKKSKNGKPRFALPARIGKMETFGGEYATPVNSKVIIRALDESRAE